MGAPEVEDVLLDRKCAMCDKTQREHFATPYGGLDSALGHLFVEKPGDEWCDRCEDWVVNVCGSPADCDEQDELL